MTNTKLKLDFSNGILEVEGEEKFVQKIYEDFRKELASIQKQIVSRHDKSTSSSTNQKSIEKSPLDNDFAKIYHFDKDGIDIICNIPGNSIAQKTLNVALLYIFGKHEVDGTMSVDSDEIKKICESHGCLDKKNFASHIKKKKGWLVVKGNRGSKKKTVVITRPGLNEANKLIEKINERKS